MHRFMQRRMFRPLPRLMHDELHKLLLYLQRYLYGQLLFF